MFFFSPKKKQKQKINETLCVTVAPRETFGLIKYLLF